MGQIKFRYISNDQFNRLVAELNLEEDSEENLRDLYEEALGLFESDMATRFILPLVTEGGSDIKNATEYTRLMVRNALRAKIKEVIGRDKSKNVIVDQGQRYIDLNKVAYDGLKKTLLNPKVPFDLKLQSFAEGAKVPLQTIGLGRADNDFNTRLIPNRGTVD